MSSTYYHNHAYSVDDGTSYASPFVAGTMAIFVGYEKIQTDADGVYARLQKNVLSNVVSGFPASTVNNLVNTGILNPNKVGFQPYLGAPGRELKLKELAAVVEDSAEVAAASAAASTTYLPGATSVADYCKVFSFSNSEHLNLRMKCTDTVWSDDSGSSKFCECK